MGGRCVGRGVGSSASGAAAMCVCACVMLACCRTHTPDPTNQPTNPTPTQPNPKQQALRLHEAVRKAEVEVSGKYVELVDKLREESAEELGRQARAFEAEKALALQELREAGQRELQARLEKEMAAFTERLTQVGVGVLIWACVSMCDPPTDMINTTIHPSIHPPVVHGPPKPQIKTTGVRGGAREGQGGGGGARAAGDRERRLREPGPCDRPSCVIDA